MLSFFREVSVFRPAVFPAPFVPLSVSALEGLSWERRWSGRRPLSFSWGEEDGNVCGGRSAALNILGRANAEIHLQAAVQKK